VSTRYYAAHAVLYVRFREGPQDSFGIWENVYLIEASSEEEAMTKAVARGREVCFDDPTFTANGRPACLTFAGIRKLVVCPTPGDLTEISCIEMTVPNRAAIDELVNGDCVEVTLLATRTP
jgi:hypothetical protein